MNFVQEATRLAELGFHVFPCADPLTDTAKVGSKGKRPLVAHGCKDATLDFDQIESWGNLYPNANIGITCTNCFVLDVDDKDGKTGLSDLQALIDRFGPLPDGPVAKSGSGGLHLFFALPTGELSAKTGIPFEGRKLSIDIRTGNSYVIAAPSLHECGQCYEWIKPLVPVEELPELPEGWRKVVSGEWRVESEKLKVESLDNSTFNSKLSTLERAVAYLAKCSPAIQGSGGHSALLWAATALIHGFGLSDIETESLLTDHYNPRCVPPWDLSNATDFKEFVRKIEQARKLTPSKPYLWLLNESPIESGVDISGIIGMTGDNHRIESPTIITEPKVSKPMTIPDRLLHIPGFIEQVVDFSMSGAAHPNRPLAFFGALACLSFLISRKVKAISRTRPNLYLLALASTGTGKDYPRSVNQHILSNCGLGGHVKDKIASGEGLEDEILLQQKILLQVDELNFTIANMAKGEQRFSSLEDGLLTLYSQSKSSMTGRVKVSRNGVKTVPTLVYQPALVLFGTATPERFCRALTIDQIEGGLPGRCIVIEGANRDYSQDEKELSDMPESILNIANYWAEFQPIDPKTGKAANINGTLADPVLHEVPTTPEAVSLLKSFRHHCDSEAIQHEGNRPVVAALWTRVYESALRLSLVYACSKNHENPIIDTDAVNWVSEFMIVANENKIGLIERNVAENPFHALCLKFQDALRKTGGRMNRDAVTKKLKLKSKDIDEIVEHLLETEEIAVNNVETAGMYRREYVWIGE